MSEGQRSIEDHAIIGNLETVALVDRSGCIDFMCLPRFDSPTTFAELLDPRGGSFEVRPDTIAAPARQLYVPDTNVLVTRLHDSGGVSELLDFMPFAAEGAPPQLVRQLKAIDHEMAFTAICRPRFDNGRSPPATVTRSADGLVFAPADAGAPPLRLRSSVPLAIEEGGAIARFTLKPGEVASFLLELGGGDVPGRAEPPLPALCESLFLETCAGWRRWIAQSTYTGRWREMVHRSLLLLKLLTSSRWGSMVAAPTFGLPEASDGPRNWDYRYTWIRDSSFVLYAFMRCGFITETEGFMRWLGHRFAESADGSLRPLYAVDGSSPQPEHPVSTLAGFRGKGPVLVGNLAASQQQLDIYGGLLDAVYLGNKYGAPSSVDDWANVARTVEWVCQHWREPDQGIWEFRNGAREYLHSRLMCWVTIDRAIRLVAKRSLPAPVQRWTEERDAIYEDIVKNFWSAELQSFVQSRGAANLDASTLLMPMMRFISPTDPRWLSTLRAIGDRLTDDVLVYRYDNRDAPDGLPGHEGGFTACSFWYIECLARTGQLEKAQLTFEKMLSYANHVGLYAEELGPMGQHLGNFPQALTHLSLISAAFFLDRALSRKAKSPWS